MLTDTPQDKVITMKILNMQIHNELKYVLKYETARQPSKCGLKCGALK